MLWKSSRINEFIIIQYYNGRDYHTNSEARGIQKKNKEINILCYTYDCQDTRHENIHRENKIYDHITDTYTISENVIYLYECKDMELWWRGITSRTTSGKSRRAAGRLNNTIITEIYTLTSQQKPEFTEQHKTKSKSSAETRPEISRTWQIRETIEMKIVQRIGKT